MSSLHVKGPGLEKLIVPGVLIGGLARIKAAGFDQEETRFAAVAQINIQFRKSR